METFATVLRAFNAEISSVRDQVTAKHAGVGRMVFWHELLENIYDQSKETHRHPVAIELQKVINKVTFFSNLS